MTGRDMRQVTIWAIVTMVVVVGILGSTRVISQNDPAKPEPQKTVYKTFSIYTTVEPAKKPYTVDIKLKVTNDSPKTETLKDTVCLVSQEFTGDPLSREISTTFDIKNTVEYSKAIELKLKSGETVEKKLTCEIKARPPKEGEAALQALTYAVMLGDKAAIEWKPDAGTPGNLVSSSAVVLGNDSAARPSVPTLASFSPDLAWPKK